MKKLLNSLYVTTPGLYLKKDGLAIAVCRRRETLTRLPLHNLNSIVVFGAVMVSPRLMAECVHNRIAVVYLDECGRFLARVEGPVSGNVLLRRTQYRAADDAARSLTIARGMVLGKIVNSRNVLLRFLRDHPENHRVEISGAVDFLKGLLRRVKVASEVDALRGVEGAAAECYFSVFDRLIVNDSEKFRFRGRNRRPPTDAPNALLSFAYTLLGRETASALAAVGLDPSVGYLHADRSGRESLALDLLEEFRAPFGDRLVLSLLNLNRLTPREFEYSGSGAVKLTEAGRKIFLSAYQERKREVLTHPFTGEPVCIGLLPFLQARLLSKYLRNELDAYPPFIWR